MPPFPHSESVVQVFLWREGAPKPEAVGSAVVLNMLGEPFLLTAAHVADQQGVGRLCLPSSRGISAFAGGIGFNNLLPEAKRRDDRFDVAYLKPRLDGTSQLPRECRPLPREHVDLLGEVSPGDLCLVTGFPVSPAWVKSRPDGIESSRLAYVGKACGSDRYAKLNYDAGATILFTFDRKHSLSASGQRAPSPRGLSGGGVFRVTVDGGSKPVLLAADLVGVLHAYHEKAGCFAATRVPHYLKVISERFPNHVRAFVDA